jgi:uncharacterized protein YceH (UPF0502 family)
MIPALDPVEVRVLGCLIEKEITTPEYYPLTANALVNACNQKSNRDPVVSYDEETVVEALDRLRHNRLALVHTGGGNRVPKYSHRLVELLNLGRRETAILCELMLRGPQTLGELRDRAGRMHRFSDMEEVESVLRSLVSERQLVTQLPRQPGTKEGRYAHLLSGEPDVTQAGSAAEAPRTSPGSGERIAALETEVAGLRERLERLERAVDEFRRQFE